MHPIQPTAAAVDRLSHVDPRDDFFTGKGRNVIRLEYKILDQTDIE